MKKMHKLIFSVLMIFLLSAISTPVIASAENTGEISVSSIQAKAGDTVQLEITLKDNPGFNYIKMRLGYDSSAMSLVSVENKNLLSGASYIGGQNYSLNPYILTWSSAGNTSENGAIAVVTIKIADDAKNGEYEIKLTVADCWNENDDDVEIKTVDGIISVSGGAIDPDTHEHSYAVTTTEPTCTEIGESVYTCSCGDSYTETIPAKGHSGEWIKASDKEDTEYYSCTICGEVLYERSTAAYSLGDVDGNGQISAADARIALRISARLETPSDKSRIAADIDYDGKVTASDARTILRISAKLDSIDNYFRS